MSPVRVRDSGFTEPSLPRSNGTPVFEAPWQARAHAMAVVLVETTDGKWDDFRRLLVDAISSKPCRPYWESWVEALGRFVVDAGLIDRPRPQGVPGDADA